MIVFNIVTKNSRYRTWCRCHITLDAEFSDEQSVEELPTPFCQMPELTAAPQRHPTHVTCYAYDTRTDTVGWCVISLSCTR